MNNEELYINGRLMDIGKDLQVRLNRLLINPAALNTVDAQYSFSITLPPTANNNEALNYGQIEETRDKFNILYVAELIVNGVRIFGPDGYFRISSITPDGYKGNLYKPAPKTIKDIFGTLKLNKNAPYYIPFLDFVTYVNNYNNAAATAVQPAIFPLALYGVIPKVPLDSSGEIYSARNVWDDTARLGIADLPPSINPLLMLKHIFNSRGYSLQGTAFNDQKLTRLYMSYTNSPEYVQPWNYGQHAKIHVTGEWSNYTNKRTGAFQPELGKGMNNRAYDLFSTDFFDAMNTKLVVVEDPGGNVLYKTNTGPYGKTWAVGQIRIPTSGYYKVQFSAALNLDASGFPFVDPLDEDTKYIPSQSPNAIADITNNIFEIRLMRDNGKGDFGLAATDLDGLMYSPNQPQNNVFDPQNIPKYFPRLEPGGNGQVNFIDAAEDPNHALGFLFGKRDDDVYGLWQNPLDRSYLAQIQAAKPALSWDASANLDSITRLALNTPGYMKYGTIGDYDPGDDPNTDIDYSAGARVDGKVLDADGNPQNPAGGNLDYRIGGYYISSLTGFIVNDPDWEVTDFITLSDYTGLNFSSEIPALSDPTVAKAAVVAFYDSLYQFVGASFLSPNDPGVDIYTGEPIIAPVGAYYARLSGAIASPMSIAADSAFAGNRILNRFQLDRYFTYTLTAPTGVTITGFAYIHDGPTNLSPLLIVPFVDGVAEFNVAFAPLITVDPRLTVYLITPDFDVDNTMVLSRRIADGAAEVIGWEATNKLRIELDNAPANVLDVTNANNAHGTINAIVWFNAGELLSVASISASGRWRQPFVFDTFGWVKQNISFDLSIQPFRTDKDWLTVNSAGRSTAPMDWDDPGNFDVDQIDLVGFLSADINTDDFIDNFCKAFNLSLTQKNAQTFSLDLKQSKTTVSNLFIDLDGVAGLNDRENAPLGLPSEYDLGFTINTEEEGYVETSDDGGGTFKTGAADGSVITQTSTFSYNWFKSITKVETGDDLTLSLPIISKSDVWDPALTYPDAMAKRYTDLAQRFWYYGGILPGTFTFNGANLNIANVRGDIPGLSILDYKNKLYTILYNYFTILIEGSSHYTTIKAYLTAQQYAQLDGSIKARYNGDLYYIAEISGYDPTNKNQTTIKLIRVI